MLASGGHRRRSRVRSKERRGGGGERHRQQQEEHQSSSSSRGRRRRSNDDTLADVKQASRQLDHIVERIHKHGSEMSKAIRNASTETSSSDEEVAEVAPTAPPTAAPPARAIKEKPAEEEDRAVVQLRCVTSSRRNDGDMVYTRCKRKAVLRPNMHEARLRSDPTPDSATSMQLRLKVSRCSDPDWTHMTVLLFDQHERLMLVVDLECRGDEARAVRVNSVPAAPVA